MSRKSALLLKKHTLYLLGYKVAGGATLTMLTPCCSKDLEVPVPKSQHEQWDSLMICPHCGELFMKVTRHDSAEGFLP